MIDKEVGKRARLRETREEIMKTFWNVACQKRDDKKLQQVVRHCAGKNHPTSASKTNRYKGNNDNATVNVWLKSKAIISHCTRRTRGT